MKKEDIHRKRNEPRHISPRQCRTDNILTRDYKSKTNVRESKGRKEYLLGPNRTLMPPKLPVNVNRKSREGVKELVGGQYMSLSTEFHSLLTLRFSYNNAIADLESDRQGRPIRVRGLADTKEGCRQIPWDNLKPKSKKIPNTDSRRKHCLSSREAVQSTVMRAPHHST